jgi:hypothetical protein
MAQSNAPKDLAIFAQRPVPLYSSPAARLCAQTLSSGALRPPSPAIAPSPARRSTLAKPARARPNDRHALPRAGPPCARADPISHAELQLSALPAQAHSSSAAQRARHRPYETSPSCPGTMKVKHHPPNTKPFASSDGPLSLSGDELAHQDTLLTTIPATAPSLTTRLRMTRRARPGPARPPRAHGRATLEHV